MRGGTESLNHTYGWHSELSSYMAEKFPEQEKKLNNDDGDLSDLCTALA